MSLPLGSGQDDSTMITTIVREVSGRGFQKRALISDSRTKKPICQRIGKLPFAVPLTAADRFKRAKPLPRSFKYGATKDSPSDFTGVAHECPQPRPYPEIKEDCLQMNIWIPEGQPPSTGWPVFFYIFGGFLQVGTPNAEDPVNLYKHSSYRAIFISFTYRLNTFGFLASKELYEESGTTGNIGFWDQRMALEFVAAEISHYGGDPKNITIGGLSAGAYSVFHQLAYSLSLPEEDAHIRRVVMWSNGCGLQPKTIQDVQPAFDRLVSELNISKDLSTKAKLARLRGVSWEDMIKAVKKLPHTTFRGITDGVFIRATLFEELKSGAFAKKLKDRGIRIMIGDCRDEITAYRLISPPKSFSGLLQRLDVDFRSDLVRKVVRQYCPGEQLPDGCETWQDVFGMIYSDLQVHLSERGFLSFLSPVLPNDYVYRYRIESRAKMLNTVMKESLGVTHGSDLCYWFMGHNFGMKGSLDPNETTLARGLIEPLVEFVKTGQPKWGTTSITQVRLLNDDGVKVVQDGLWKSSIALWRRIHDMDRQRL